MRKILAGILIFAITATAHAEPQNPAPAGALACCDPK